LFIIKLQILNIMEEKDFYYFKCVTTMSIPDETSGKIKKKNEEFIVRAVSPTDVEAQMVQFMTGTVYDWSITSVTKTKIESIIHDGKSI
jgi:tRNA(Glu) U13 pseudouridine synthase TruD